MTQDLRPRTPKLPKRGWQRKWAVRDDFKSDEAFIMPTPWILNGEMLNTALTTADLMIDLMFGSGFIGLVVDADLVRELFDAWKMASIADPSKKVDAIQHMDYPSLWFVPTNAHTRRGAAGLMHPTGIEVMMFWVRPRVTLVTRAGGDNGK